MKSWIITVISVVAAIMTGGIATYLLIAKGMKWPAGILGLAAITGMLVLPKFRCSCHRNNPLFWYLPHNRFHR